MSKKPRELLPEEKRLWRRVAADVKPRRPLKPDDDEADAPPIPSVRAAKPKSPTPKAKPPVVIKRDAPPADRGGERRVKRGQVEIAARLDLHGHTHDSGFAALRAFLQRAHRDGARTVLVITGQGRGGVEGVLKRSLPAWLEHRELKAIASGYARAHRAHGGAGAAYIFLRRKSDHA